MSKPFLENMSKEERQAFSYLENLIIKSKMECLSAIPKTQIYDDSKIKSKIISIESKWDKINLNFRNILGFMDIYHLTMKNNESAFNKMSSLDEMFECYSDLFILLIESFNSEPFFIKLITSDNWKKTIKEYNDLIINRDSLQKKWRNTQDKYNKRIEEIKS